MPRAHDGLLREIATAIAEQRGERGSLVVVGAHHFGSDYNDPLYAAVANIAWSSVLLVEASPLIAATLRTRVRERNPTPRVPPARVIVVNEGVCPSSSPASELPFYTLDTRGLEGLPRWADQVSSFKYQHVQKHTSSMARKSNHSAAFLRTRIVTRAVRCGPLLSLLEAHAIERVGALMIDTEGLDCQIVAAQAWTSPRWCRLRPQGVLLYEKKHCDENSSKLALEALDHSRGCSATGHAANDATKRAPHGYRRIAANDRENAVFALSD